MAAQSASGGDAWQPRTDPLARTVYALLVVACFAAFFVTQRLKHTPTVVQRFELNTSFSPGRPGPGGQEAISFKLAQADEVTVTIEDLNGNTVATLVTNHAVPGYKQLSLRWNGRRGTARTLRTTLSPHGRAILVAENTGPTAPAGEYRVRVHMRRQDRDVLSPRDFTLVRG